MFPFFVILTQLVEKAGFPFVLMRLNAAVGAIVTNKRTDDTRPKLAKIIVLTRFRDKKNSKKVGLVLREQCHILLVEKE